jgi:hypothetical protein
MVAAGRSCCFVHAAALAGWVVVSWLCRSAEESGKRREEKEKEDNGRQTEDNDLCCRGHREDKQTYGRRDFFPKQTGNVQLSDITHSIRSIMSVIALTPTKYHLGSSSIGIKG